MPQSEEAFQEAEQYKARMRGMGLVVILLIATASLSNGTLLMTRKLWMDEIHSWLIVTDNSTSHAMMALSDGADFNPPSWFLVTENPVGDVDAIRNGGTLSDPRSSL